MNFNRGTMLMNKTLALLIILPQIYHNTLEAINFNFNFMKKRDIQKIEESFPVPKNAYVEIYNTDGSITIKPWNQQKIALDIQKSGDQELNKATTITRKLTGNELIIRTNPKDEKNSSQVDYTLRVPEDISLKIEQTNGDVNIQGIEGTIDVSLEHGSIDIKGSKKTVNAKTGNGTIAVQQTKLTDSQSIFCQCTDKGNITLSLPPETHASVHAQVEHGSITSDHAVTMTITTKLDKVWADRLKKEVDGTLGSVKDETPSALENRASITLETGRGTIHIKES